MKTEELVDEVADILGLDLSDADEVKVNKSGILISMESGDIFQLRIECLRGDDAEPGDDDDDDGIDDDDGD